jgi:hypothetical protein
LSKSKKLKKCGHSAKLDAIKNMGHSLRAKGKVSGWVKREEIQGNINSFGK